MKRLLLFFILFILISPFNFSQEGYYGTVSANNSRGSAPTITLGSSANTCSDVGNLKTGKIQVRNLSGSTMDNYISSESCFLNTHSSSTSVYKNMWFKVTVPSGSSVTGLYFYSSITGVSPQPSSSTNIRTAYLNIFSGTSTCAPELVCSDKYDNSIMSYNCCSSPYLDPLGSRRFNVTAGTTYYCEVWTTSFSTDANYNFDIHVVPVGSHQSNESCSSASVYTTTTTNCNLGSYPSCNSYVPSCWWTVDNSVFFKFTRPSGSTFQVTINSVTCQGGAGYLQAAIFKANTSNCTSSLTSSNELTCDDNNGTITLTVTDALTAGTEYILWLDGDAGAACKWGITVLDVDLTYFKANCQNQNATIEWASLKEKNNNYYIIERSSNGLEPFEEIGTVSGSGNSYQLKKYEFIDYRPLPGTSYYRLKQVDWDGSISQLGLISFESVCNENSEIQVFPNPSRDILNIELNAQDDGNYEFEIINSFGEIIKHDVYYKENNDKNYPLYSIDLRNINPGVYYLSVKSKFSLKKIKFIKAS